MKVIEVPGVELRNPDMSVRSSAAFLESALGEHKKIHYMSRTGLASVSNDGDLGSYPAATVSLLVQAAHEAFNHHIPLSLSPEVLWYAIVHEVAHVVKGDARAYAHMFTATPDEKQIITVRDDSLVYGEDNNWERSIGLVRAPLREKIASTVLSEFLPQFSTMDAESEAATLVSFMDVISTYYDFEWHTMCGIPAVRMEGTAKDWELLRDGARLLALRFPPLSGYFTDLLPVLDALAAAAAGVPVRTSFWKSLYKYNGGSGGPYVGGWITAFFAYLKDWESGTPKMRTEFDWERSGDFGGLTTDLFPPHISKVDFVWDYLKTRIPMSFAGGVLGIDMDDGFLRPRLGIAVVERGRE